MPISLRQGRGPTNRPRSARIRGQAIPRHAAKTAPPGWPDRPRCPAADSLTHPAPAGRQNSDQRKPPSRARTLRHRARHVPSSEANRRATSPGHRRRGHDQQQEPKPQHPKEGCPKNSAATAVRRPAPAAPACSGVPGSARASAPTQPRCRRLALFLRRQLSPLTGSAAPGRVHALQQGGTAGVFRRVAGPRGPSRSFAVSPDRSPRPSGPSSSPATTANRRRCASEP